MRFDAMRFALLTTSYRSWIPPCAEMTKEKMTEEIAERRP
jgi:hypothetical protein